MHTAGGGSAGLMRTFVEFFVGCVFQEKSVSCYVQNGRRINPLEFGFARLGSSENPCIRKKRFEFTGF
jgi:hypothetical protein